MPASVSRNVRVGRVTLRGTEVEDEALAFGCRAWSSRQLGELEAKGLLASGRRVFMFACALQVSVGPSDWFRELYCNTRPLTGFFDSRLQLHWKTFECLAQGPSPIRRQEDGVLLASRWDEFDRSITSCVDSSNSNTMPEGFFRKH